MDSWVFIFLFSLSIHRVSSSQSNDPLQQSSRGFNIKLNREFGLQDSNQTDDILNDFTKDSTFYERYGEVDKHYSVQNGVAFILCEKFNSSKCRLEGDCTPKIEKCIFEKRPADHTYRPGCMAAFAYNHTGPKDEKNWRVKVPSETLELRGCWSHDSQVAENCAVEDECLAHYSAHNRQPAIFCCCKTHNCNMRNKTFVADSYYYYREVAKKTLSLRQNEPITEEDLQKACKNMRLEINLLIAQDRRNPKNSTIAGVTDLHSVEYSSVHWSIWFSIGLLSLMLFVLLLILGSYLNRAQLRKKRAKSSTRAAHPTTLTVEQQKARLREDWLKALKVPNLKEISNLEKVAMGRFAEVFKGSMSLHGQEKPIHVAVKRFRHSETESFMHETEIFSLTAWKARQHPYLTKFYGVYITESPIGQELSIITEFQRRGNLYDFCRDETMGVERCLHIMFTLLDGVTFLHEEGTVGKNYKCTIVHRDIKSRNVLLREDYSAVLTDFGLAMQCDKLIHMGHELRGAHHRTTPIAQVGTTRYMAPEVLEGATEFSAAAFRQMDVYAVGLILWEIISRTEASNGESLPSYKMPYEDEVGKNPSLAQMRDIVVSKKIRPSFRKKTLDHAILRQLAGTGEDMWDGEADGRITAGCALERIKELSRELTGATTSEEEHHDSGVSLTGSVNSACMGAKEVLVRQPCLEESRPPSPRPSSPRPSSPRLPASFLNTGRQSPQDCNCAIEMEPLTKNLEQECV